MTVRLIVPLVLALAVSVFAQEPTPVDAAKDPQKIENGMLVKALEAFAGNANRSLAGGLAETEAEGGGPNFAFMGGPGGGGKPFTGDIEVVRTEKGEELILSKSALPGIAVYMAEGRKLTQTTIEDEAIGTGTMVVDLDPLLHLDRLIEAVKAAGLEGKVDAASASIKFKGELSKDLIKEPSAPRSRGGMMMGSPKVLRVHASITLDAEQKLRHVTLSVTRSDPMAAIRRQMQEGGGRIEISDPSELDSDEEGKTVEYSLTVGGAEFSARAKQLLEQMRAIKGV